MQLGRRLPGALIAEVLEGSPASRAGLRASKMSADGTVLLGDLITSVDGAPVQDVEDLLSAIEEKRDGQTVRLRVQRGCDPNREETVRADLVSRSELRGSGKTSGSSRQPFIDTRGRRNGANQVSTSSSEAWQ